MAVYSFFGIWSNSVAITPSSGKSYLLSADSDQLKSTPFNSPTSMSFDGGAGTDTVAFKFARNEYTVTKLPNGSTTISGIKNYGLYSQYENITVTNFESITFSDVTVSLVPTGGNSVPATQGNDKFVASTNNDAIDGVGGIDTVQFAGNRSSYTVNKAATGWTLSSAAEGTDNLTSIERLQFADKKIALDLKPSDYAGQAVMFIGLMAPNLIKTPSVVGVILDLFDQGKGLLEVCQLALDVGLVKSTAGSSTNAALAAMAFKNVIGSEANAATVDMLVGYMDGRSASYSQAEFMTAIANLEVNQTHIGLIGLQQTGIEFS